MSQVSLSLLESRLVVMACVSSHIFHIFLQDDKEKKKNELLEKKAAAKEALLEEESQMKSKVTTPARLTRAQIQANKEKEDAAAQTSQKKKTIQEQELEENPNQAMAALLAAEGAVEARSVEDAITTLRVQDKVEMHPEKRMKAAYAEFEERELPRLKRENPNLRLSQLKQMLRKDWMKSPENPLNQ